ncbi:MAG: TlpA disulfide reductase family protein [Candidatus Limnocylindrales bacterium]
MRLPDVLGVLGALVVGAVLAVLLLASAASAPPVLPSPVPPTIPPLPTPTKVAEPSARPTIAPGETATPGHALGVGQEAPPLEVTLTDGSLFDSADYTGHPLWVNFMATWTPQSAEELPLMKRYQKDLGDKLTILVVDVGEERDVVRQFVRGLDVDLPVALDTLGNAQALWGAYALPVHLFIDVDGVVQQVIYGGAAVDLWDQAIALVVPDFVPPESSAEPEKPVESDGG